MSFQVKLIKKIKLQLACLFMISQSLKEVSGNILDTFLVVYNIILSFLLSKKSKLHIDLIFCGPNHKL
ncbi:hypothetical protein BpHYR1_007497 [Brachionus plicatilis]|uniref:Uncharacterized protein n=1 Tax=Brachionus plicatilis TaxID=10195 RepID=A0A3M7RFH6_BRAPC|nr:hypothetical protein BpHYR1_007497 [Brachionus plicatilis]